MKRSFNMKNYENTVPSKGSQQKDHTLYERNDMKWQDQATPQRQ